MNQTHSVEKKNVIHNLDSIQQERHYRKILDAKLAAEKKNQALKKDELSPMNLAAQKKEALKKNAVKKLQELKSQQKSKNKNRDNKDLHSENTQNSSSLDSTDSDQEKKSLLSSEMESIIGAFLDNASTKLDSLNVEQSKKFQIGMEYLLEFISDTITRIETQSQTSWSISLSYLPQFNSGAILELIEYSSAPKQYNLIFRNVNAEIQTLLEINKNDLARQLAEKEISIHQIITHRAETFSKKSDQHHRLDSSSKKDPEQHDYHELL